MQLFTKLFTALLFVLFFAPHFLQAQTDTAFWYVAPEISQGGSYNFDRPIYFRISSFAMPSTVTVSEPANPSFAPITLNLASNSAASIDLTPFITNVENSPPDMVNNFGLHIHATNDIAVYYEVIGGGSCGICNAELYSLKGRNALGTSFWVPIQQTYDNYNYFSPLPYSSINIVAPEDATTLTITPTQNLVGHAAGTPFNITLNRGQTYAGTAASELAAEHPSGSTVVSNKPVAITMNDDYININGAGQDADGDQLIPVDKIGTEYIVISAPNTNNDLAIIVATQNNTQITANGVNVTTINAGATYQYALNGTPATYINTTAPVYVYQLTTDDNEAGGAILPPIRCTGSSVVSVTRSTSNPFNVFLITPLGNEGNFLYNGSSGIILASSFSPVPTIANWEYARVDLSSVAVVGGASRISNTSGLFAMGLLQGVAQGASYGYFSDFGVHNTDTTINSSCSATSVSLKASIPSFTHLWSTNNTNDSIKVNQSGTYWVQNISPTCINTDTFFVAFSGSVPLVKAGNDTTICANNTVQLNATGTGNIFSWSPATALSNSAIANPIASPTVTTSYVVADSNACGTALDTTVVTVNPAPQISLISHDTTVCTGNSVQLNINSGGSYSWSPNTALSCTNCRQPLATPTTTTTYKITLNSSGCSSSDSVIISIASNTGFLVKGDTTICAGGAVQLYASAGYNYAWSPAAELSSSNIANPVATPSQSTTFTVIGIGKCGNQADSVMVNVKPAPALILSSGDTSICLGDEAQLYVSGGSYYQWFPRSGLNNYSSPNPLASPTVSTTYTVVAVNADNCSTTGNISVQLFPNPEVNMPAGKSILCGQEIQITPGIKNVTTFHWKNADGLQDTTSLVQNVSPRQTTTYTFVAANGDCTTETTVEIKVDGGSVFLPNAFSPNNDGNNDKYQYVYSCGFNLDYFRIYNRWGQLVFETSTLGVWWDGKFNGKDEPVGAYAYVLSGHGDDGKKIFLKGNVTLIR